MEQVTKFQSVKLADGVDPDSRAVEQDVKVQPAEEERGREERPEFGERPEEPFEAPAEGEE